MSEEPFDVVDQQDRVLWQAPRSEVHARHWLHRASHIFVFNSRGELLVHRRSATKDECPLMYTSSASGHLAASEDYESAAARELQEELGLASPVEFLTVIPADGAATSYEHSGLFRTVTDQPPCFDPGEIESGEFLPLGEVSRRLAATPQQFTPCFRALFAWYLQQVGGPDGKPYLGRIAIYPVKGFDPVVVEDAQVLASGAMQHDRRFALVDAAGRFMNGKRTERVHRLQVHLDPATRIISVRRRDDETSYRWHVDSDRAEIGRWFSEYFLTELTLVENETGGFPDDTDAPGPTLVSTATLQAVADWFPGLTIDQVRLRFRANLEVSGVAPFWEDRLVSPAADGIVPFRIGELLLAGTNPCQRCVVPSRDPATGDVWPQFSRQFAEHRSAELPVWSPRERFSHYYRLCVNTRLLVGAGGILRLGDAVKPE